MSINLRNILRTPENKIAFGIVAALLIGGLFYWSVSSSYYPCRALVEAGNAEIVASAALNAARDGGGDYAEESDTSATATGRYLGTMIRELRDGGADSCGDVVKAQQALSNAIDDQDTAKIAELQPQWDAIVAEES